jgi:hypothetical protein
MTWPNLLAEIESRMVDAAVPVIAIAFGCLVAIIAVISVNARKIKERQHREESRREIAAYVAEGSMNIEQAEKLMAAGESAPEKNDKW